MKAILNGNIIESSKINLFLGNRGFKYGDGLFETIALFGGHPRLLELHLSRLHEGAEYLGIEVKQLLRQEKIEESIRLLQQLNNAEHDGIVRLYIWRNGKGKYVPSGGDAGIMLTIEKTALKSMHKVSEAGFSKKVVNYPSEFSRFKTMSALKYVIAGIEKEAEMIDEIIILDHVRHISEALSSNIFWKKDEKFFTPPLTTGCIAGVMRQWMMHALKQNGHSIEEKLVGKTEFLEAESIFTTNAVGIGHIQAIGKRSFKTDQISQQLFEQIC